MVPELRGTGKAMMLVTQNLLVGALHTVKMLLSNTAVPIFGSSHEAAFRIRQRRRDIEGNRAERLEQPATSNGRRSMGLCVVVGAAS